MVPGSEQSNVAAYQDECGDLYCPEHAKDRSHPYTAEELRTWRHHKMRCDFCGASIPVLPSALNA